MSNHTPGPWTVEGASGESGEAEVIESDNRIIAWTADSLGSDSFGILEDEDRANARLIAAAPDLLAALRKAADYMAEMGHPANVLDEARAAIAKVGKGAHVE